MIRKVIIPLLIVAMAFVVAYAIEFAPQAESVDYTSADVVFSLSDTAAQDYIVLFYGSSLDTIGSSGITIPDTFALTGLINGTTYPCRLKYYDTLGTYYWSPHFRLQPPILSRH